MTQKISNPKTLSAQKRFPADIAADVKIIIEKYPRIGNRIVLLWGSVDLQNYLNTLIIDERGSREGFPQPIADAILRIYGYHGKLVSNDL